MKLLLIRHGETIDNVAHVYAGVTDSPLTSYGVLQVERLASHIRRDFPTITHIFASPLQRARKTAQTILRKQDEPISASSSRSSTPRSDTRSPSPKNGSPMVTAQGVELQLVPDLIEQDFGSFEGEPFLSNTPRIERMRAAAKRNSKAGIKPQQIIGKKRKMGEDEDEEVITVGEEGPLDGKRDLIGEEISKEEEEFKEIESTAQITRRVESFILQHLLPLLPDKVTKMPFSIASIPDIVEATTSFLDGSEEDAAKPAETVPPGDAMVVIVSHGILLSHLWKCLSKLFHPTSVLATTLVVQKGWYQGKHPGWGNTGYLQLNILLGNNNSSSGDRMTVVIEGVNEKEHLKNLRRTRGGIGSAKHDDRQRKMHGYLSRENSSMDKTDGEEEQERKEGSTEVQETKKQKVQ